MASPQHAQQDEERREQMDKDDGDLLRSFQMFPTVSKFIADPDAEPVCKLRYRKATHANLQPGSIFHMQAAERIMLVLRRSDLSVTCLTLCQHEETSPAGCVDHWSICAEGEKVSPAAEMPTLEAILKPYGPQPCIPHPGTTIYIRDIYNVDLEIPVATLGYVKHAPLRKLVETVQKHFCDSLDEAVKPLTPAEARAISHSGIDRTADRRKDVDRSPRQSGARVSEEVLVDQEEHPRSSYVKVHGPRYSDSKPTREEGGFRRRDSVRNENGRRRPSDEKVRRKQVFFG